MDLQIISKQNPKYHIIDKNGWTAPGLVRGWFLLTVEFESEKINIDDIMINGESIKHCIYTGVFQTDNGERHFAPSLWEPGKWTIWLHPNVGHYLQSMFTQINNGDYGKNLDELYLHTVDMPTIIDDKYPKHIKDYFAKGYGPRWWHRKNIKDLPYKVLHGDFDSLDREKILCETKQLPHKMEYRQGWNAISLKKRDDIGLPMVDYADLQMPETEKMLRLVGYKSVLNVNWIGLDPYHSLPMHRDDIQNIKQMDEQESNLFTGCVRFYWNIKKNDKFKFKMGEVGILPTDKPLLINPTRYAHCVVNDSNELRESIQAWGIL